MIALLAPLIVQVAASGFAPPLDRALSVRVSEVREDGSRTLRFVVDRRVIFRRAGDGFTAEVETLSVTGEAGRAGRLFAAMARAFQGRRVILRLDAAGGVTDIDDIDALWDAQIAAVATTLPKGDASRDAVAAQMLAPLRSLPRSAKIAQVADLVAPLIFAGSPVPVAQRAITLPARAQDGTAALLAGTERTTAGPDGMLLFERDAQGEVSGAAMSVTQQRRIDPLTRMIAEVVSTTTTETAGVRQIVTRTTALKP